jgi:hypothetical protein
MIQNGQEVPLVEIKMHIEFSSEYMNRKHVLRNVRDDLKE